MMRKKEQQPKGNEEKVHCLQKPIFSHFAWAYGPRGNSHDFFLRFGTWWEIQWTAQKKNKSKHNQGKERNKKQMMRKKDQQPKGKEEKVHCLQNQFFHIVFGPMGLGETLAFFFCVWEAMGNPMNGTKKKQEQAQSRKRTQ